jgi:hypothetical protein
MTASAVESQTVLAFDSLAAKYDDLFTRSMIGRAQRGAVWDALIDTFEPGSHSGTQLRHRAKMRSFWRSMTFPFSPAMRRHE